MYVGERVERERVGKTDTEDGQTEMKWSAPGCIGLIVLSPTKFCPIFLSGVHARCLLETEQFL